MNEKVWHCTSEDTEMNKIAAMKTETIFNEMHLSYKVFTSDDLFDAYLINLWNKGDANRRTLSCSCEDSMYRTYLVTYTRVVQRGRISEQVICLVHDEEDIANIEDECRMLAEDHIRDFSDYKRYFDEQMNK